MIGTISVELQASRPNMPLDPVFVFKDSYQFIEIVNVPKRVGDWELVNIFVEI